MTDFQTPAPALRPFGKLSPQTKGAQQTKDERQTGERSRANLAIRIARTFLKGICFAFSEHDPSWTMHK